jgi:ribulose-5-phosphate 4-epimerase/fuculose-1-phosphate aldolase
MGNEGESVDVLRRDLAACFRLVALYGWDDLLATHISVRLPGSAHEFLVNPYGLLFEEIRASDVVRLDVDGNTIDVTKWPINPAAFVIHSAIHMGREDARCVLHLHTTDTIAVSALETGLLPLSQVAMILTNDIGYHNYEGYASRIAERERLQKDLGAKHVLILRNHGILTIGESVVDAFMRAYYLQRACEIQVKALACGQSLVKAESTAIENLMIASQGEVAAHNRREFYWPALLRRLDKIDPKFRD